MYLLGVNNDPTCGVGGCSCFIDRKFCCQGMNLLSSMMGRMMAVGDETMIFF
jgi:hypothetical protein